MHRKRLMFGLTSVAAATTLLAGCSGGGEAEPTVSTSSTTTIETTIPAGQLDPRTCITLAGLRVVLGRTGTYPSETYGDGTRLFGVVSVTGNDLRTAAKVLMDNLTVNGNILADRAHADAIAAHATTEIASDTVDQALQDPISAQPSEVDNIALGMLDQARMAVRDALVSGCHTFVGDNLMAG